MAFQQTHTHTLTVWTKQATDDVSYIHTMQYYNGWMLQLLLQMYLFNIFNPVITNSYYYRTDDVLTCDFRDVRVINIVTLLLWWTCGLLVVFLFRFNGSVRFFLSRLYQVCDESERTGNIPHLLQSRWTGTATHWMSLLPASEGSRSRFERCALHSATNA